MPSCPVCGKVLIERPEEGEPLHYCAACGGVWMSRTAFRAVTQSLACDPAVPNLALDKRNLETSISHGKRSCPECSAPMREFNYAADSGIFLDRCDQCGGIWADKEELRSVGTFLKGNEKLDRLGEAIADHERTHLQHMAGGQSDEEGGWLSGYLYGALTLTPVADDQPTAITPVVTISLIIVNVVIAFATFFGESQVFEQYGLIPRRLWQGQALFTLITSGFLHVGPLHIIGNMLFLWIFGDNVEDRFGHARFALFYLVGIVAAALAHAALHPDSMRPAVGASGAVSAVMGAYLVLHPLATLRTMGGFKMPAIAYLGIWLLYQIGLWFLESAGGVASVAWAAHLGGFAFGFAVILVAGRRPRRARPGARAGA